MVEVPENVQQFDAYANYVIYFSDLAEYNFAVGLSGGTELLIAPFEAASRFGMTDGVHFNVTPLNPDKGMYTTSEYELTVPGTEILFPLPSGVTMDADTLMVTVLGQMGNPPFVHQDGPDMNLYWSATLKYTPITPGATVPAPNPDDVAAIPQRRWITGFEVDFSGEGGTSGGANFRSRDSSRVVDGVGWGLRNANNINLLRSLSEYGTPPGNNWESWERFYIRPRVIGGADIDIWKSQGLPSVNNGIRIWLKTDLTFDIFNVNSANVQTLLDNVGQTAIDTWAKIDIIVQYNNIGRGNTDGRIRIWQNGILLLDELVLPGAAGLGVVNQTHANSLLGTQQAGATTWELDLDDWTNAEIPNIGGVETLNSIDWTTGVHIKRLFVNGGTNVGWSGQVQGANQMPNPELGALISTSTTPLAVTEGITELGLVPYPIGTIFSTNAFLVSSYSRLQSGAVAGELGYRFAGGAAVFETILEGTSARYNDILYPGSGVDIFVDPTTVIPFNILYRKANNVTNTELYALQGEVEFIGVWGLEDATGLAPTAVINPVHNAWYPFVAQAFLGPVSDAPVAAVGGTYVGNGTTTTVSLRLPAHFIWIRPVGSTSEGTKWYAASLGGHAGPQGGVKGPNVVRADYDPLTQLSSFTVIGNGLNVNQNAITYQYIVFCDPGYQFNLCQSMLHSSAVTGASNLLFDSIFTPIAAFFQPDRLDNDTTTRLIYKGAGIGGTTARVISGTAVADAASFAAGEVTTGANLHSEGNNNQIVMSLWRMSSNCAIEMVQIFSYVGDGTGNRVINFPNTTSRCALLICVQPDTTAQMVTRDPSDTAASSRTVANNGTLINGIIAVDTPDQFTVGSNLNNNGITYSVFIILGDVAGMNNGEFYPFNCISDPLTSEPEPPLPGIAILSEGGLVLNGTTPLSLLQDVGGIYTIIPGKTDDTLYDRQPGQTTVAVPIPNPRWKTGYIGG